MAPNQLPEIAEYEDNGEEGGNADTNQAYAPYMFSNKDKADLLDKIRPDVIVEKVRHNLMGEEYLGGKWVRVPYLSERAISPTGAWEIASVMLPVSSQNVALSDLKDSEIKRRTIAICDAVMESCLKNWKEYGIHGIDQMRFIYEIVFSNTFITLKQCANNGIRRLIQGTTTELRSYSNIEQNKPGMWSNLWKAKQSK